MVIANAGLVVNFAFAATCLTLLTDDWPPFFKVLTTFYGFIANTSTMVNILTPYVLNYAQPDRVTLTTTGYVFGVRSRSVLALSTFVCDHFQEHNSKPAAITYSFIKYSGVVQVQPLFRGASAALECNISSSYCFRLQLRVRSSSSQSL